MDCPVCGTELYNIGMTYEGTPVCTVPCYFALQRRHLEETDKYKCSVCKRLRMPMDYVDEKSGRNYCEAHIPVEAKKELSELFNQ